MDEATISDQTEPSGDLQHDHAACQKADCAAFIELVTSVERLELFLLIPGFAHH